MKRIIATVALASSGWLPPLTDADTVRRDVCVYGGTSGGVAAAVQVARMGKSVVLISDYGHLGGMTSSGLGWTDIGDPEILGGISREFYHRVYLHYLGAGAWTAETRASFGNAGQGGPAFNDTTQLGSVFEPKIAEGIFDQLIAEAGVTVIEGRLDLSNGVSKTGARISAIHLEEGATILADMFIDTSYEGDLMAGAGVTYRVGREFNSEYSETANGNTGVASKNQLPNGIDPYVIQGNSGSGLLPGVNATAGGSVGDGDDRFQAYCYRMVLTDHSSNRVAVAQPAGYAEADYELLFRAIEAGYSGPFFKTSLMPNRKTDSNNTGGLSTDYIGKNYGPGWDWTTLDHAARAALAAEHRDWQLGLIWTLQNHARVPVAIRNSVAQWGLPADEFTDHGNWPYNLYVREGRRMVADLVMTEDHCRGNLPVTDPVGMGAYTMDSHNTQRFVDNGMIKNEGDKQAYLSAPYGISYRALVPMEAECENLLVPWAVSATHIAFGSIRMEPVFMILGQSAGTAAVIAIDDGVSVQQVNYEKLALKLGSDGQVLDMPSGTASLGAGAIIVDSEDAVSEIVGSWGNSSSVAGYNGSNYKHDGNNGKGTKSVTLRPTLTSSGVYRVYLKWTSHDNRASNVPITLTYDGGVTNLSVNQRRNGGQWMRLGAWPFLAGTTGSVRIDTGGTDGYVIADAAAWDSSPLPPPEISILACDAETTEGDTNDSCRVTLVCADDLTGVLPVNISFSGQASPGSDFSPAPATVSVAAVDGIGVLEIQAPDDGLAEGDETIVVSILPSPNYVLGAFTSTVLTVHDAPFDAWRATHFSPAQLLNTNVSGSAANPDGDETSNLGEFFANTDPLVPDQGPRLFIHRDGEDLQIELRRNPEAAWLSILLEESSVLEPWTIRATTPPLSVVEDYPWEYLYFSITPTSTPRAVWRAVITIP